MTLRRGILLIIGITLAAPILGLYKVSSSILPTDLSRLEQPDVVRDVKWSKSTRVNELADLDYTADAMIRHGISEDRIAFLGKPFTPEVLAQRVREVLDGQVSGPVESARTES
jgi:hypothetical protein